MDYPKENHGLLAYTWYMYIVFLFLGFILPPVFVLCPFQRHVKDCVKICYQTYSLEINFPIKMIHVNA